MALKKLLLLFLCGAFAGSAAALEEAARDSLEGNAPVYETRHFTALELPQKLWNGLVYPLGEFVIYAEHSELPKRVRNWFTNEEGTFGLFPYAQLGGETDTGVGFNSFHTDLFGREKEFGASYIFSAPERQTGQALYYDPNVGGSRFYWGLEGDFLKTDNGDATVNGALEQMEDLLETAGLEGEDYAFALQQLDVTAKVGWRLRAHDLEEYQKNIYVEGRVGLGRRELSGARTPFALPGHTADAARVAGLGKEIPFFSVGGRIAYDDRDHREPARELSHPLNYVLPGRVLLVADDRYYRFRDIAFPERGGLLEVEGDLVSGSEEVRYLRYGVDIQRFFTLFWRDRILGLRARLDRVHPLGNEGIVPYVDLPTLGGGSRLRGYKRGSFRGEGALLLSAEYRYPIWDTWNAFLFWDEGQVFDRFGDIDSEGFRSSFGGGISLRTERAFLLGLRLAHSKGEKALLGFSLEKEF